jgi:hypothetical protein
MPGNLPLPKSSFKGKIQLQSEVSLLMLEALAISCGDGFKPMILSLGQRITHKHQLLESI